jgi:hypothetical protein
MVARVDAAGREVERVLALVEQATTSIRIIEPSPPS